MAMSVGEATNLLAADVGRYVAAEVLIQADRERCVEIFRRYVQTSNDAWGPGASNPPKASDYIAELLTPPELTEPEASTGATDDRV